MDKKKFRLIKSGVFQILKNKYDLNYHDLNDLLEHSFKSKKNRSRICYHHKTNEEFQEMFIAFNSNTYVEPSKHNYNESFSIVRGTCKYLFFDNKGKLISDVRMGNFNSDLAFYLNIPHNTYHSLLLLSDNLLSHEVVGSKFSKKNTYFPIWSKNLKYKNNFINKYSHKQLSQFDPYPLKKISKNKFILKNKISYLRKKNIDLIIQYMLSNNEKKISIDIKNKKKFIIQESICIYSSKFFNQPLVHLDSDKSFKVLDGEADFILYDKNSNITQIIELSSFDENKSLFCRIKKNNYYIFTIKTSNFVVHESIKYQNVKP